MIRNYFKVAWRNLWKNKVYSAINIAGLSIGMAACILIMLFVFYERSFDNFHTKNIYRLNEVQKFEGMVASQKVALSMFPMGPTLKAEFPEIKNFTRINWDQKTEMTYKEKRVYLPQTFLVDSTFLQVFDFKLLTGNRETALQKPNSIVLTQASVEKIFGKEDPIGKTISHYGRDTMNLIVTGIVQNTPQNSQLQFDALISFNTIYRPDWMNNWGGNWLDTYFELAPHTNIAALEKRFPAYLKNHMARNDNWKNYELFLLPLKTVHASASDIGLDYLNYQKFDKNYTNIFFAIALIVLLIACINFMNLSTARSSERAREVGIRKSIGAHRWQLGLQFISESVILSLIALALALILVKLSLPFVNNLSERHLQLPLFSSAWLFLFIISGTAVIGVLSGLYPSAYLSAFQPVKVLKGSVQTGRNKSLLRNILVVAQFSSAIFLMVATVFAVKQLHYMQDRDPGFNRDQVVTIPLNETTYAKFDVIKQDLLKNSLVSAVTGSQDVLGSHLDQSGIQFKGDGPLRQLTSTRLIVDHDYLNLYNIHLLSGNNFSSDPSRNGKEYIINEALAKELLKDDPKKPESWLLGKNFGFDSIGTIVGIAKDFNFNSLHYKIETMFMFNQKDWSFNNISVKINGGRSKDAISFIQSVWQKNCPDVPFEYQFLDDHFAEVYRADTQVSRIVGILATLAIIISCLGLFGLATYSAERRVKEVGIRKVLGASVQNITAMLSKDFLKYVFIAAVIALPLAWLRNLVRIDLPNSNTSDKLPALFKKELGRQPNILTVAARNGGRNISGAKANGKNLTIEFNKIDDKYLPAFKIPIITGRNFSPDYPADSNNSVIVNESFVKEAGWKISNAVGQTINFMDEKNRPATIVGVIKDYHFASLKEKITPELFSMDSTISYGQVWVKIDPNNVPQTLTLLEGTFKKLVPFFPYSYQFMDDINAKNYETQAKWKQIIGIASGLFVFISCIGLLGLVMLSIEQRTKEIGIRKVLGAAVSRIMMLISKEFIILILIAFAVATPVGYYFIHQWLQDFAYRINISWWMFPLAGVSVIIIALMTLSYQAIKAAFANPAKSLKME